MTSKAPSTALDRTDSVPSGIGAALGDAPCQYEDDTSKTIPIALKLEARDLPNLDTRGKSDPFVILYRKLDSPTSSTDEWQKVAQTETVYNNLNPKWSTTFTVEYRFGTTTVLRFSVYDRDCKDEDLSKHDYIGEVRCTIAQVVLADNQRLVLQVNNKNAKPGTRTGTLTIRGEEQKGDLGDNVTFQFAVKGLRRGRKPFYVLSSKNRNDNDFSPVIYSEVHQSYAGTHHTTTFKPITKSLARLTNGDLDRELEIQFNDYDRRGNHYRGGSVRFTLRNAKSVAGQASSATFPLRKRRSSGQVAEAGVLIVKKCEIATPFSFIDYIRSGIEINTVFAVDMSNTNGNPADPRSLQYRDAENEYVIALREVGTVLAAYDTTKTFPVFGFGATLPPAYEETAHCFALTPSSNEPVCSGIEEVIKAYLTALHKVGPYEPCRYGPVLQHVIKMTRDANMQDGDIVYTVLLLITDGDFADFADVANLICDAAELPLSIVIVGVGNSRFLKLERLDGDKERLCSTGGIPCARDIVQFVQFHNHRYNPTQLAREVLDEIPDQLVSYMRSKGIKPADIPPRRGSLLQSTMSGRGPYLPDSVLQSMNSDISQHQLGNSVVANIPPPPIIPESPVMMPTGAQHISSAAMTMTAGSPPPQGLHQANVPLPNGLPQANAPGLPAVSGSMQESIPPPPSLDQITVTASTMQHVSIPPASMYPQSIPHPSLSHTGGSHTPALPYSYSQQPNLPTPTSFSPMLCPPTRYPPVYGSQAYLRPHDQQQPSNRLHSQLRPQYEQHPPQYAQQQSNMHSNIPNQPYQYLPQHGHQHQPQQHHPRPQHEHYPQNSYPYGHLNGHYLNTYPPQRPPDLSVSYASVSAPTEQSYQYPPGSLPLPHRSQ